MLYLQIPILLLFSEDANFNSNLDKFLDREHAQLVKKSVYNDQNLTSLVSDFVKWAKDNTKLVRFNLEIDRRLDNYLKEVAKKNGTNKAQEIRNLIKRDMDNTNN